MPAYHGVSNLKYFENQAQFLNGTSIPIKK